MFQRKFVSMPHFTNLLAVKPQLITSVATVGSIVFVLKLVAVVDVLRNTSVLTYFPLNLVTIV